MWVLQSQLLSTIWNQLDYGICNHLVILHYDTFQFLGIRQLSSSCRPVRECLPEVAHDDTNLLQNDSYNSLKIDDWRDIIQKRCVSESPEFQARSFEGLGSELNGSLANLSSVDLATRPLGITPDDMIMWNKYPGDIIAPTANYYAARYSLFMNGMHKKVTTSCIGSY